MARLEDVLPALREGKKIRRKGWHPQGYIYLNATNEIKDEGDYNWDFESYNDVLSDDWEIVFEPTRVADYLVEVTGLLVGEGCSTIMKSVWLKQTHPIGSQPKGSVLVPNSEREVTE